MGCINSRSDINDQHPNNIFEVTNIDDRGTHITYGKLEITETELILHQKGKVPIRWPVRCLRKYGFDASTFSFESGRRCPTGEGIYAFRCFKAEQLFNMLQQTIQLRNVNEDNNVVGLNSNVISGAGDFPIPLASTGPPVHRRLTSTPDGYLNPTNAMGATSRPHLCLTGADSAADVNAADLSASPVSGNGDVFFEHNNNKDNAMPFHFYANRNPASPSPTYINLDLSPTINENYVNVITENTHPVYMNVVTNSDNHTKEVPKITDEADPPPVLYTNMMKESFDYLNADPATSATPAKVNYVELELNSSNKEANASSPSSENNNPTDDSPTKVKKSYATIDFNKTNALSQSVNQRMENDQGSRKTRHNSTISDVPARHSNSSND